MLISTCDSDIHDKPRGLQVLSQVLSFSDLTQITEVLGGVMGLSVGLFVGELAVRMFVRSKSLIFELADA